MLKHSNGKQCENTAMENNVKTAMENNVKTQQWKTMLKQSNGKQC